MCSDSVFPFYSFNYYNHLRTVFDVQNEIIRLLRTHFTVNSLRISQHYNFFTTSILKLIKSRIFFSCQKLTNIGTAKFGLNLAYLPSYIQSVSELSTNILRNCFCAKRKSKHHIEIIRKSSVTHTGAVWFVHIFYLCVQKPSNV